jgi:hypothetical protein
MCGELWNDVKCGLCGWFEPSLTRARCPRCENEDCLPNEIIDGCCAECRLAEEEADWTDEAEGPLN